MDLEDHKQRVAANEKGYHVALKGDRVVGVSYSMRSKGVPTEEQLNKAIARLHNPRGGVFYFQLLLVSPSHRGKGVDAALIEKQLEDARARV